MKRKLLITSLLTAALCMLFAFCVCAASTNEFGVPEAIDGIDLTGMSADTNARIVIKDGDEYHTYPAQYFVTNADTFTYDFSRVKNANGKSYTKNSVVRIEIPDHVLMMPATGVLSSCAELVEIKFSPNSECHSFLYGCFYNNKKMKIVYVPPKVTTMGTLLINNSTIEELIFMDGFSAVPPKESFIGASGLKKLVFSNQMTTMHPKAFHSTINKQVEAIYFGESLLDLGELVAVDGGGSQGNFAWLQGGGVTRLYASDAFFSQLETIEKGHTSGWTGTSAKRGVVFYTGTQAQAQALIDKASPTAQIFYGATLMEWDSTKEDTDSIYQPSSGWIVVYNYNKCKAFYGNEHDEKILNSCQYGCARGCGAVEMLDNPQHSYAVTVTYGGLTAVDYYKTINVIEACENCKHEIGNKNIDPLFTDKGYSVDLTSVGISQSFKVNKEAIALYMEYVDSEFEYGVVASIGNANPLALENGEIKTVGKSIASGMTNTDFALFNIKVVGIPEEYAASSIAACAYVLDRGEIYYLSENQTAFVVMGVSYEALKALG